MPLIKIGAVEKSPLDTLPEGKYEVFVDKFDEVSIVDGVEVSRIMFTIRKDVEDTTYANRKVFTNIKSSDNFAWLINAISKAVGIPVDTAFENLTDFLTEIKGKPLVVKVKHRPNPKDASKPYVNITDFIPTTHVDFGSADLDDDTIPF
jgi:hypothetical protein